KTSGSSRQSSAIKFLIYDFSFWLLFREVPEPPHVQAKFLFGMRCEGASPALAFLDEPKILRQMRPSISQSALWADCLHDARFVWRRLCRRTRPASGPATTDY